MPDFTPAVAAIHQKGYFIGEQFWPASEALAMAEACQALKLQSRFRPACIGRAQSKQRHTAIRSDLICWLDEPLPAPLRHYLDALETYRQHVNRELLLGLDHVEVHAAYYPPGAHYDKHLDRHRDDDARTLTAILYLNPDWQHSDGGLLEIDLPDGSQAHVEPRLGTFVSFLSAEFVHAVQPTQRDRLALTGWYRRRGRPF